MLYSVEPEIDEGVSGALLKLFVPNRIRRCSLAYTRALPAMVLFI